MACTRKKITMKDKGKLLSKASTKARKKYPKNMVRQAQFVGKEASRIERLKYKPK